MRRKIYSILCLIFVAFLIAGYGHNHIEGEPDVISSMKVNLDERLIVVANRDTIEDKEEFAELLIQKCKDNSFQSIKFSTDHGYATSLVLKVYLWRDQINGRDPVMEVEYLPVEWGKKYDIIHNPEKFQMYIDGKLIT